MCEQNLSSLCGGVSEARSQPGHLLIIGLPGAGKTTVAKSVAKRLGREWIDTDLLLEAHFSKTCREITLEKGADFFRGAEREVIAALAERDPSVVSLGGGAIYHPELLKRLGAVVYIAIDPEVAFQRVMARGPLPSYLQESDPKASFLMLAKERESAYAEAANFRVESGPQLEQEVALLGEQLFRKSLSNHNLG